MNEDYFDKYEWSGKTILIVEDNVSSLFYLQEVLKETNAELIVATDGKMAVQECLNRKDIDIVLMDIQLPVLNGYAATRNIKELRPELPVIIQTAHAMVEDRRRAFDAGGDDYLTKPLNPALLLEKINKFLKELEVQNY